MPVDRPTFSESWYRVHDLRPRLRSTVQVYRQHFRGQMWHVLQDPGNNQFFRLNEPAYQFVGLLDGRRTVAEAWRIVNQELGDNAPTQGEAIQLLGQLYSSNLLQAELPPDAEAMFKRYRRRVRREIQGYLSNLLFIRIPLFDPDHFLDRWVGIFGRVFTWYGAAVWLALMAVGIYFVLGNTASLTGRASTILDPENLPLLYVSFILVKVFHEFGHAFACKKFGQQTGTGGEVHVMGIMMLVFTPIPYIDATSAWAFRDKWHRVIVGAAGMLVELAVAAVAAIVWARTASGTVHAIAYNVMFIASVSTLLFNGNPLLRYDGYYILSDLIEIPNLAQRSREYIYYLVKHFIWNVRQARSPAHAGSECAWFVFYGPASTVYRVWISIRILLFVADKLFFLGALLAVAALVAWVLVPLGRFLHYLGTSGELARVRGRATGSTVGFGVVVLGVIGLIPAPDRFRIEGVVEPIDLAMVYARSDGFVADVMLSNQVVTPEGPPLVRATNEELVSRHEQLLAERRRLEARRRLAQTEEIAAAQILARQIQVLDEQIDRLRDDLDSLVLKAPIAGTWVSPEVERFRGAYVRRGDPLGLVASLDRKFVRATAGQQVPLDEAFPEVEMRMKGRPQNLLHGRVRRVLPGGSQDLPSAALGYPAGGAMAVSPEDRKGTKTVERFLEVLIDLDDTGQKELLTGQRVVVRLELPRKPLALQWTRSLLQLIQRRFHIVS